MRRNNIAPEGELRHWLNNEDCVAVVRAALVADEIPGNYAVLHAVSENPKRIHDLTNTINWKPK